jgi:hypothetical protein
MPASGEGTNIAAPYTKNIWRQKNILIQVNTTVNPKYSGLVPLSVQQLW